MKKINKKIFLLLALSLILISCTADKKNIDKGDNKKIEVKENQEPKKEESKEEKNVKETKADSKETTDKTSTEKTKTGSDTDQNKEEKEAKTNSYKDGMYLTILSSENMGEAQGEIGYCKSSYADSSKNIFTIEGSLSYNKDPKALEGYEIMVNSTYEFAFDENTVFQATSGMADPEIMTIDEFNKYLKECKDSGLGLVLVIENGHLKSVSISS